MHSTFIQVRVEAPRCTSQAISVCRDSDLSASLLQFSYTFTLYLPFGGLQFHNACFKDCRNSSKYRTLAHPSFKVRQFNQEFTCIYQHVLALFVFIACFIFSSVDFHWISEWTQYVRGSSSRVCFFFSFPLSL